jgi:hypothetical protein
MTIFSGSGAASRGNWRADGWSSKARPPEGAQGAASRGSSRGRCDLLLRLRRRRWGKLEARRREIEARPAKGARGAADGPRGAPAEGAPWVAGGGRKGAAQGRGGDAWLACAHLPEVGFRRAGGRVPEGWRSGSYGGEGGGGGGALSVEEGRRSGTCGLRRRPSVVAFSQLLCFPFFRETESEPVRWGGGN